MKVLCTHIMLVLEQICSKLDSKANDDSVSQQTTINFKLEIFPCFGTKKSSHDSRTFADRLLHVLKCWKTSWDKDSIYPIDGWHEYARFCIFTASNNKWWNFFWSFLTKYLFFTKHESWQRICSLQNVFPFFISKC